jgi:hypothetical protein
MSTRKIIEETKPQNIEFKKKKGLFKNLTNIIKKKDEQLKSTEASEN